MGSLAIGSVARQVGALFAGGTMVGLSDAELLDRFAADRDEAAFAALVSRHGPMVLGVCRRILGDHQHAEDAFQAVFLVLARRASGIHDPERLGNWLYGVAVRTSRCARRRQARRVETESKLPAPPDAPPADESIAAREHAEALHVEIARLPEAFRMPVVLCYLEGLTVHQAADRLGCSHGTIRSRMARGRAKLRRALTRRGLAPALAMLDAPPFPATVSPLLRDATTSAAIRFASGSSTILAREVLRMMLIQKIGRATLAVFVIGAVAAGAAMALPSPQKPASEAVAPKAQTPKKTPDDPARMIVTGRVLDPDGKPVSKARVMAYATSKRLRENLQDSRHRNALGRAISGASGRFRLDLPRISTSTHDQAGVLAMMPGFGVGWTDLDIDAERPAVEVALGHQQVIEGRLFDLNGQPAAGVPVHVEGIGQIPPGVEASPEAIEGPFFQSGELEGELTAWPRPATTGADGRFRILGIGRGLRAVLMVDDPRYARHRFTVETNGVNPTKTITEAIEPARVIKGRVTYADTGRPVPNAIVEVFAAQRATAYPSFYRTDADGFYRANPEVTSRYAVSVSAPEGEPYLGAGVGMFNWPTERREYRADLTLKRGVMLKGRVVEETTGRPIAGASIGFTRRGVGHGQIFSIARTGPDGTYRFTFNPTPGTLTVLAPSDDYILQETTVRLLDEGRPGQERRYAHAIIPCDFKADDESPVVDVTLRRGTTVEARVTTPDGAPAEGARVYSRLILSPGSFSLRYFLSSDHRDVHDGRFMLHGLAPDDEVPVFFLDPKRQWGASAMFSVRAAKDGPIPVRLQPCGSATVRLVDPKGMPIAGFSDPYMLWMAVTPGADPHSRAPADLARPSADGDFYSRFDTERYEGLKSDADGRLTFPTLIPGASYRITDRTAPDENGGLSIRMEFVARPGETIDLGDLLIQNSGQ